MRQVERAIIGVLSGALLFFGLNQIFSGIGSSAAYISIVAGAILFYYAWKGQ